jgi:hypothetical protein
MKLEIDIEPDFYFGNISSKYCWDIADVAKENDLFINIMSIFIRET